MTEHRSLTGESASWLDLRALGLVVLVAGLGVGVYHARERTVRIEFSPDRFEIHTLEWERPYPNAAFSKTRTRSSAMGDFLRTAGYLPDVPVTQARWDLCRSWHRGPFGHWSKHGSARSFAFMLRADARGWIAWSKLYPDLAARLWSRVAQHAQAGEYGPAVDALYLARLDMDWSLSTMPELLSIGYDPASDGGR